MIKENKMKTWNSKGYLEKKFPDLVKETSNAEAKPKPEKFYAAGGSSKGLEKPKDNGIHLTIESVRSNALASAIEYTKEDEFDYNGLMKIAKRFEQYILTGE